MVRDAKRQAPATDDPMRPDDPTNAAIYDYINEMRAQREKDGIDRLHPDYDGPLRGDVVRMTISSSDDDEHGTPVVGCGLRIYGLWAEAAGAAEVALKLVRAFDDLLSLASAADRAAATFYGNVGEEVRRSYEKLWQHLGNVLLESDSLDTDADDGPVKKKGGARKPSEPAHTGNGNGNGKAKRGSRRS